VADPADVSPREGVRALPLRGRSRIAGAPLGARVSSPKLDDAVSEFGIADSAGFESIGHVPASRSEEMFAAYRADMHDGCAAYRSQTNQAGVTQLVNYEGAVSLPRLGDDVLAVGEQISVGRPTHAATALLLRRSNVFGILVWFGADALSDSGVQQLAQLMNGRRSLVADA
jgi:hypothetical protein